MSHWVLEEKNGSLAKITFADDPFRMNWVNEPHLWGEMVAPNGISCTSARTILQDDTLEETYIFTNESQETIFCDAGSVSISLPLNDNYLAADICLPQRCHAHVWCGGEVSWVLAIRMGGQAPHLGMILTQGSLESYSIQRSLTESHCVSNTRGVILLHPKEFSLAPEEKKILRWRLFRHEGIEDWKRILKAYFGSLYITSEQWVAFHYDKVKWNGGFVDTSRTGEIYQTFQSNGKSTTACWRIMPPATELLRRRAQFIVEKQQCMDTSSHLCGAYLIYDNETNKLCYSHDIPDHNSARERLGMGALVALACRYFHDAALEKSLWNYADFILREIYEEKIHTVYDDAGYMEERHRLYNEAWVAVFFMELFRVTHEPVWIKRAADVMENYYDRGGDRFYAIGIPMTSIVALLKEAGMTDRAEDMRHLFIYHAEKIADIGIHYPTSEVDYEQSIVAPAVNMLLMGYQLSGKQALLSAAREQMKLLILFQGMQPDYHFNEVAIRHWDGYWFGKRHMLGDTFPHYWSSLSGLAFERYGHITGEKEWLVRAEKNLRGSLPLFFEDGSASCAMVYPRSVNGVTAHFYDPWANDQDWGLYYYFQRE